MNNLKRARQLWRRSFFTGAIYHRYLLTPVGTVVRRYSITSSDSYMEYLDVYIFGIRITRIHRT